MTPLRVNEIPVVPRPTCRLSVGKRVKEPMCSAASWSIETEFLKPPAAGLGAAVRNTFSPGCPPDTSGCDTPENTVMESRKSFSRFRYGVCSYSRPAACGKKNCAKHSLAGLNAQHSQRQIVSLARVSRRYGGDHCVEERDRHGNSGTSQDCAPREGSVAERVHPDLSQCA